MANQGQRIATSGREKRGATANTQLSDLAWLTVPCRPDLCVTPGTGGKSQAIARGEAGTRAACFGPTRRRSLRGASDAISPESALRLPPSVAFERLSPSACDREPQA